MLLQTLRYAGELEDFSDLKPVEYPVSDKKLDLAVSLVKPMAVSQFDLTPKQPLQDSDGVDWASACAIELERQNDEHELPPVQDKQVLDIGVFLGE